MRIPKCPTIYHIAQNTDAQIKYGAREKILWKDGKMEGNGIQPNSQPIIG
jgi:hypothetical protein